MALKDTSSPFTVKGGGHTAFPKGSSIAAGVTIDLAHLNEVTVADDRESIIVGPGARWGNVSSVLDLEGLAVVGGRVTDVGVSGLILGGGLSFFSGKRGWACDNVRSFEVVVSSGEILTASPESEPELYWALRGGGGSSFGIVTRFELDAFPQGKLWSGSLIHTQPVAGDQLLPLLPGLINDGLENDSDAHMFAVYTYQPTAGGYVAFTSTYHATPSGTNPKEVPKVFQPLYRLPSLSNTTMLGTVTELSSALAEPYGIRATWWDTSISASSPTSLFQSILHVFEEFVAKMLGKGEIAPFLVFQPVTKGTVVQMGKKGGNALGLEAEEGGLWVVQVSVRWSGKELDGLIEEGAKKTIENIEEVARKQGQLKGFNYMNYAGSEQDVIASYGQTSASRLKNVARKYDPERVLAELWDGYFQVEA